MLSSTVNERFHFSCFSIFLSCFTCDQPMNEKKQDKLIGKSPSNHRVKRNTFSSKEIEIELNLMTINAINRTQSVISMRHQ